MNYKELVKQAEAQSKAKANIAKAVAKNKSAVLAEFSKDIIDYLLFIHKSPDFRFSGEAHWHKGEKTHALLDYLTDKGKEPFVITNAKKDIQEKAFADIRTSTLGFGFNIGSAFIKLKVNDDFVCKVSYEFGAKTYEFTDKEEFVKKFTELLIAFRKDV